MDGRHLSSLPDTEYASHVLDQAPSSQTVVGTASAPPKLHQVNGRKYSNQAVNRLTIRKELILRDSFEQKSKASENPE